MNEKELLDFYQQQAKLSPIPWLAALQRQSLQNLANYGFPSHHNEAWKYTKVDTLLQHRFTNREVTKQAPIKSFDLPLKQLIRIQNGSVFGAESLLSQLPSKVIIKPLSQALAENSDKIKPHLGKLLAQGQGFQALNTAMLHCGIFIYLPAGICIDEPIALLHWQDQPNQAVHSRHLIIAEPGSKLALVEDYHGVDGCSYFSNTVTEICIAEQAKVQHYKLLREGNCAYHIGNLLAHQERVSQFASHSLSVGGKLVRSDTSTSFYGEEGSCLMNGIYAPGEGQHMDHQLSVLHKVPNCSSEQDYRGILRGNSKAIFHGKVMVEQGAQHSQAKQQNKNLLLADKAEVYTKPQLEIFADDVICTHGATIGQLDEEALFYLATRGIDKQDAVRYLINAFSAPNLQRLPHAFLAEWMANQLSQHIRN